MSFSTRLKFSLLPAAMLLLASSTLAQYTRTDLVTDTGTASNPADPTLVNGWGLVSLPTSPFWVSDNGTGKSTLYTGTGVKIKLTVTILGADGGQGSPTGVVGNPTSDFILGVGAANPSKPAAFIFSTFDGTISGWNGGVQATIKATSQDGAVYTGLAIGNFNGANFLYAADDGPNRKVDIYDTNFQLVNGDFGPTAFVDPNVPKEFAPYGIQTVTDAQGNETVWVTYTGLNKAQSGFAAAFTTGGVFKGIELHGPLHSPWGIALAPPNFGQFSNALLISNNIPRGRIEAFDPNSGAYLGFLHDGSKAIEIDDIWAIQFGHGGGPNGDPNQLFYTAGPDNYGHGIFGVINP